MVSLTDRQKGLIVDLINIAWGKGAVLNPQMAQAVELLRKAIIDSIKDDSNSKS